VVAAFLVGMVGILSSDDVSEHMAQTTPFGVTLMVISQCFYGGLVVVEEKLFSDYELDPLQMVGLEGLWGCLFFAIFLPFA